MNNYNLLADIRIPAWYSRTPAPSTTPTRTPTMTPTSTPSLNPNITEAPSISPSATPSISPSAKPSASPSATPSTTPTAFILEHYIKTSADNNSCENFGLNMLLGSLAIGIAAVNLFDFDF